jgi:hypothetical protein
MVDKCENLLSKLAHLIENFDQHQHSVSEKLSGQLSGKLSFLSDLAYHCDEKAGILSFQIVE